MRAKEDSIRRFKNYQLQRVLIRGPVTYLSGGGKVGDKIRATAICDKSKSSSYAVE